MHKFIRWYNQNREVFFIAVIIIALIIIFIQILNSIYKERREESSVGNSSTNTSTTISTANESVITGETISDKDSIENTDLIKTFVEYCNNGEVENAYNMLTDECKELIYPSIDYFRTNYYERIFYINRMYNLENWFASDDYYIYYIKYTEDVLASGDVNSSDNKGDYITVVKKDSTYQLNISSYVGRDTKTQKEETDGINMTLNWIDMYIDYTVFNISVKNNTDNTICIDTKEDLSATYVYDTNSVTYSSFMNEVAEEQLIIKKDMTSTLNIKFNKMYNTERELTYIVFSDVVTNYEEYINGTSDKNKLTIKLKL